MKNKNLLQILNNHFKVKIKFTLKMNRLNYFFKFLNNVLNQVI